MSLPVICLGSGITLLATIRCLAQRKVKTYCPCPPIFGEEHSRYFVPLHPQVTEDDSLEEWLKKIPVRSAVLIGCSDAWTRKIALLPAELKVRYPSPVSLAEHHVAFTDKAKFKELTTKYNVPTPRTFFLDNERDAFEQVKNEPVSNFFLKPRDSQTFVPKYGVKGFWGESWQELEEKAREVQREGFTLILQEYIRGPGDATAYCEGYIPREESTPPLLFARKRMRSCPPDFGNTSFMKSVAREEIAEAFEITLSFLRKINYHGIFSAECKYDAASKSYKIIEINGRPWWYVGFPAQLGVNVPLAAYSDLLGRDIHYGEPSLGRYCMNFFADFSLFRQELFRGNWSALRWIGQWPKAYPAFFRWSDPLPALTLCYRKVMGRLGLAKPIASPLPVTAP